MVNRNNEEKKKKPGDWSILIKSKERKKKRKIYFNELLKILGTWLFLIGILISIIVGLIIGINFYTGPTSYVTVALAVLGFVVGILSFFIVGTITKENLPTFLIAALLLIGIGASMQTDFFKNILYIGPILYNIAVMIVVFAAPAAGLLAIRAIWDAGKSKDIEKVIPKTPK